MFYFNLMNENHDYYSYIRKSFSYKNVYMYIYIKVLLLFFFSLLKYFKIYYWHILHIIFIQKISFIQMTIHLFNSWTKILINLFILTFFISKRFYILINILFHPSSCMIYFISTSQFFFLGNGDWNWIKICWYIKSL